MTSVLFPGGSKVVTCDAVCCFQVLVRLSHVTSVLFPGGSKVVTCDQCVVSRW